MILEKYERTRLEQIVGFDPEEYRREFCKNKLNDSLRGLPETYAKLVAMVEGIKHILHRVLEDAESE